MRALILESKPLLAWVLEDNLASIGFEHIEVAPTESVAIKAAAANCPDLIVANSHLRNGSGVAAVRAVCADREIATIFITTDRRGLTASLPNALVLDWPHSEDEFIRAVRSLQIPSGDASSHKK